MKSQQISQKLKKIINTFQQELQKASDPDTKKLMQRYFKEEMEMRGLKSKQIEEVFKNIWPENKAKLSLSEQKTVGMELFKSNFSEDRILGCTIFRDIHKNIENKNIDEIQNLILQGYAKDWGTIDTLCMRLLTPWTKLSKENTEYIAEWRFQADNQWVRRASCVTFVNRAKYGDNKQNYKGFSDLMFEICQETVKYDERFNQLGNGWLMRNLSVCHRKRAIKFIEDNYDSYTREGLRYAIEKLDEKERKRLLNYKSKQKNTEEAKYESEEINDDDNNNKTKKPQKTKKQKKNKK